MHPFGMHKTFGALSRGAIGSHRRRYWWHGTVAQARFRDVTTKSSKASKHSLTATYDARAAGCFRPGPLFRSGRRPI